MASEAAQNATHHDNSPDEHNPAHESVKTNASTATSRLVSVGHWSDPVAETGCTAVVFPQGTIASYEVRGGAPASRELIALEPEKSVSNVDGVCLTGGSVYGLSSADGVVKWLAEQGRGVVTPGGVVPIVPTMALFDLAVGDGSVRPSPSNGYDATRGASENFPVGRVGAGTGACSSKWRQQTGPGQPGGLGFAQETHGEVIVEAIVACNAFGDISDSLDPAVLDFFTMVFDFERQNTTIGVVVTNARLDKAGCRVLAQGAHDGLARAITPPHSRFDGDGFVAAATGEVDAHLDVVRMLALTATSKAIQSLA
jgi:L-aminopeptidase/D-esterase-like protein